MMMRTSILRWPHILTKYCPRQKRQFAVVVTKSAAAPGTPHMTPVLEAEAALKLTREENGVQFVDASWFRGEPGRGLLNYQVERIPGAVFFDIDEVADKNSALPHMLPSAEEFALNMTKLGVRAASTLVVYSQSDCFSGPRCWWTFKVFGHPKPVYFLNGGLSAWKEVGGDIEVDACGHRNNSSEEIYPIPQLKSYLVADKKSVQLAMNTGIRQICDARNEDRFMGRVQEPRPGVEAGHIPGSLQLSFTDLLDPGNMARYKEFSEIRKIFDATGVVSGSEVIFTCGSGVTAAVLALARNHIGADEKLSAVYDGSWTEWGSDPNTPKMNVEKE